MNYRLHIIKWEGPIPENIYDYDHNDPEVKYYFHGEMIYPEIIEDF